MSAAAKSQTLFVTGTDTDAGKTYVASALLRRLRSEGLKVCGYKPLASGCIETPEGLRSEDALALIAASGSTAAYQDVNPYAYGPAIAPHLAAAELGERIEPERLRVAHARLTATHQGVVAEGAGGWLTPLGPDLLLGEWVAAQAWPVLLVVELKLGCLNHALLTAEAIRRRTRLAGWVANLRDPAMPWLQGNLDSLESHLGAPLWVQRREGEAPGGLWPRLFPALEAEPSLL
ncbi:MAG: dethiobiotin synthase [Nevskiaceae bacterium]|nr:MAG: dethiobiotin synthase [Nevskiaceae bacterium]TAM33146.1 MAG: dethiobiotin synthase [Nevskiaceae bacterium]